MAATQIITYLRNHLYLPHLDLLLYFTPDKHNGVMVLLHLLIQPILEFNQITSPPNNLLHHTIHLLPQPPRKLLPNLLLHITYPGLHNRPHHYHVLLPALLRMGGGGLVLAAVVGIEGFMVCSVSCRVLRRSLRVSGSLFSIFGLKQNTETQKQDWKKIYLFRVTDLSD